MNGWNKSEICPFSLLEQIINRILTLVLILKGTYYPIRLGRKKQGRSNIILKSRKKNNPTIPPTGLVQFQINEFSAISEAVGVKRSHGKKTVGSPEQIRDKAIVKWSERSGCFFYKGPNQTKPFHLVWFGLVLCKKNNHFVPTE